MVSEQLKKEAYDFIEQVESVARDEGYQVAKQEFDAKVATMQADFDKRIVEARETYYNEGYKDGKSESPAPVTPELPTEKIVLADGEEYKCDKERMVALFSYSRKFPTNWATIVLPVALEYPDWGELFDIAEITDVSVSGSTITPVRKVLGWGTQTVPNHPYLIRAKSSKSTEQTIQKTNCSIHPSVPESVVITKDGKKYTFKGTYVKLGTAELSGKYYSSNGVFVKAVKTCGPMRVILEISK